MLSSSRSILSVNQSFPYTSKKKSIDLFLVMILALIQWASIQLQYLNKSDCTYL